jgi:peptidoglycan-associated lipoprotein
LYMRSTCAAVGAAMMVLALGCGKKDAAVAPPPPPPAAKKPVVAEVKGPALETGPARVDSFTVEPTSIERGQSATLRWAVTNATEVALDQGLGAVQATGSRQIFPSATTTYTLTARSAAGTDSRTVTATVITPPAPPPTKAAPPPAKGLDPVTEIRRLQDILFDYDQSELRPDARAVASTNADVLKRVFAENPTLNVVVEGHCDERGTAEYNLGLGDRRASIARDYLVQLGVPANRLRTISFGEERPACTDADEGCYQRNRRAHLEPAQ